MSKVPVALFACHKEDFGFIGMSRERAESDAEDGKYC
jgi:hypothetical protein